MNLSDLRRGRQSERNDKKLVELLNERSLCALSNRQTQQKAKIPRYHPPTARTKCFATAERTNPGPLTRRRCPPSLERI